MKNQQDQSNSDKEKKQCALDEIKASIAYKNAAYVWIRSFFFSLELSNLVDNAKRLGASKSEIAIAIGEIDLIGTVLPECGDPQKFLSDSMILINHSENHPHQDDKDEKRSTLQEEEEKLSLSFQEEYEHFLNSPPPKRTASRKK